MALFTYMDLSPPEGQPLMEAARRDGLHRWMACGIRREQEETDEGTKQRLYSPARNVSIHHILVTTNPAQYDLSRVARRP